MRILGFLEYISLRFIFDGETVNSTRLLLANGTGALTLDRTYSEEHMVIGLVNGTRQTFKSRRVRQEKIAKHRLYSPPL